MALDNGHWRPIVDCGDMVRALDIEYERWKSGGVEKEIRSECIENINTNYLWPDKIALLKKIFSTTERIKINKETQAEPVLEA